MARITSERAVESIGNRFNLVLVASQRARELRNGSTPLVDKNGNTPTVLAIREIEEGKINANEYLRKYARKNRS